MSKVAKFRNAKTELAHLFREAAADEDEEPTISRPWLFLLTLISLFGTMVPIKALSATFCIASLVLVTTICARKLLPKKTFIIAAALLAATSIATGCSPLIAKLDQGVIDICEESTGKECKVGTAIGWSLFGIPVRDVDIANAQVAGGIDNVFGLSTSHGYGVVGVTKVVVYGS